MSAGWEADHLAGLVGALSVSRLTEHAETSHEALILTAETDPLAVAVRLGTTRLERTLTQPGMGWAQRVGVMHLVMHGLAEARRRGYTANGRSASTAASGDRAST